MTFSESDLISDLIHPIMTDREKQIINQTNTYMDRKKKTLVLEDVFDVLANNTHFCTSEEFAQEHAIEIDYDLLEITITDDETGESMTLCVK